LMLDAIRVAKVEKARQAKARAEAIERMHAAHANFLRLFKKTPIQWRRQGLVGWCNTEGGCVGNYSTYKKLRTWLQAYFLMRDCGFFIGRELTPDEARELTPDILCDFWVKERRKEEKGLAMNKA
jgi:hypothetical protein